MNCGEWEERLALYTAGDLGPEEAARAEQHLAECPGCQVFASGMKASLELLHDAHGDVPAPAHFAAVRARVLAELEGRRQPFWRRRWVCGLAAAAALVLLVVMGETRLRVPDPPAVALAHPPAASMVAPLVDGPGAVRGVVHARALPRRPGVVRDEPVLVRVVTDNPDVVIYWIADKRGE